MKIEVAGRLLFKVESRSRPGEHHTVDLEPCAEYRYHCSCERFSLNPHHLRTPCHHIAAAVAFVLENCQPAADAINLPEKQAD